MRDFFDIVHTRRSVRKFSGDTVKNEEIEKILRAGMQAPSAHNKQPWVFLTITDRQAMRQLMPLCRWWGMLEKAAFLVVNCMDIGKLDDDPREFFVDSCCAAAENMVLTANAMGLGATWLGVCKGADFYEDFCRTIALPVGLEVVNMLAFGIPEGELPPAVDRFDPTKWVKERFTDGPLAPK